MSEDFAPEPRVEEQRFLLFTLIAFAIGIGWEFAWSAHGREPEHGLVAWWSICLSILLTTLYRKLYRRLNWRPRLWQVLGWIASIVFAGMFALHEARPETRFAFLGRQRMVKAVDADDYVTSIYSFPANSATFIPAARRELVRRGFDQDESHGDWFDSKADPDLNVTLYKGQLSYFGQLEYVDQITTDQKPNWVTVVVQEPNPWLRGFAP